MVKKKLRKGFKRSEKEWEESIATHIGKLIDRLSLDDAMTLIFAVWGGLHTGKLTGAMAGGLGYKLATSMSLPSSLAGLGLLAFTGLVGLGEGPETVARVVTPVVPVWIMPRP